MGPRTELHAILVDALGSENVYFQPPESIRMEYPCIVYFRDAGEMKYADGKMYHLWCRYQVTYISRTPDDDNVIERLASLPLCEYDRHYVADNLHHDVFNIYY